MKLFGGWKRIVVISSDVFLTVISYWFAFLLRFNFSIPEPFYQKMLVSMPVLVVIRLFSLFFFGLYSGMWRYASISDLARILKAIMVSS
ncbi:MAG: multidrug transporter, partial [Deltaproteobacteria bacterium]|nr:multidrug transporter [Deltaproteobacteria bacterium]